MGLARQFVPRLLVLCFCPWAGLAKLQAGFVRISGPRRENHWKHLSKFGYSVGVGSVKVRLRLHRPKSIAEEVQLEGFSDEDWPAVEAEKDVCDCRKWARLTWKIGIKADGQWGDWVHGTVSQHVRPRIWSFVLTDCDGVMRNVTHRLKSEFHAAQEGGSEFSVEMRWILPANVFFFVGFGIYTWWNYKRTVVFRRSAGCIHPVIWILCMGVFIHCVAQVFHTLHLYHYRSDGAGIKALEVLSEILFMLSQVIQTSLLILIALGYTLLQSRIGELDLMIPMCFMVGVIHIMLVGFGKLKDDESYKYHENEGVIGWILLIMRLLLYAWFSWAVQSSAREGGARLRSFLGHFFAAGSVYFLAYPLIFLLTKMFAPYLQHTVLQIGLMVMQASSNVWLATLFLTRGEYFRVSTLSDSELPGGVKIGMTKEE